MCLREITKLEASIAEQDIVCYKMVEKHIITGEYRSFYQFTPVNLNTLYKSPIKFTPYEFEKDFITIALHSFILEEDAIKQLQTGSLMPEYTGEVIKCIIPAGSKYYIGITDNNYASYASNALYYTGEIIYKFNKLCVQ